MTATFDDTLAQRALSTATPTTIPLVKRSAYLADALRSLDQTGGQNLRSPGALGANLLADALLTFGQNKADKKLAVATAGDQASLQKLYLGDLLNDPSSPPGGGGAPPAAPPQATPPTSAPIEQNNLPPVADARPSSPGGLADALSSPPTAPAPNPAGAPPMSDADRLALAQMVYGEARGEPAAGQQATAAVALNRARQSGQPVSAVIGAPGQFEGYNPRARALAANSPQLAPIMQNLAGLLSGTQPDPTGGADHFYSPGAQAALGRPKPAWDNGSGQMIGNQDFLRLGSVPPPPGQGPPQGQPPVQVASNGPLPQGAFPQGAFPQGAAPPQGAPMQPQGGPPGPGAAPMPPMPSNPVQGAPLAGGQAPPVVPAPPTGGAAIPTGPGATPQETAMIRQFLSDPRTRQMGMELAAKVRQRQAAPAEAPKNMVWSPQAGQYVPMPGTQTTQLPGASPSDSAQRDMMGNVSHSEIHGVQGTVPPGTVLVNGQYVRVQQPTDWTAPHPVPNAEGLYQTNAVTGEVRKAADAPFSAKDVGGIIGDLTKSEQYQKASHATDMYRAATNAATRPGGMTDAELVDFAAQELSGGVARQFNQKMIEGSQGPIARLKQYIPELVSGQKLSPAARSALLTTMKDYATEAQGTFRSLAASKNAFTQTQGVSLDPYLAPLMRDLPDVPQVSSIPNGMPGGMGGNGQQPGPPPGAGPGAAAGAPRYSPQQLQAEIARRRAAGLLK